MRNAGQKATDGGEDLVIVAGVHSRARTRHLEIIDEAQEVPERNAAAAGLESCVETVRLL
jgi:hypothetical protein